MQTRSFRTLVKITRVGSFAVAAEQLNMTLSAVSMQMKALEGELGVQLFNRTFRPPKLTPLGREIAQRADTLLGVEDDLVGICRPSDRLVGRFRTGFVPTASVRLLPGFLKMARSRAPDARFDLQIGLSEVLEEKLLGGELDIAVVTASDTPDPRLDYLALREESLVLALPSRIRRAPLETIVEELPFLLFAPRSGIGKVVVEYMRRAGVKPSREMIVLDNVETIMECVKSDIGFTLLPAPDVRRYGEGRVALRPTGDADLMRRIVLATSIGSAAYSRRELLGALFRRTDGGS